MIRVSGTAREVDVWRHWVRRLEFQLRDDLPAEFRNVEFAVVERHSPSFDGTAFDSSPMLPDHGLVTYTEAARLLGCSTETIGRRVREGQLIKVGRRVTRESVAQFGRGER